MTPPRTKTGQLAEQFEAHRPHLVAVAYRMLGVAAEAEDAVQDAWLRVNRADADGVDNVGGWLTTVVSRICLDMLRSRSARETAAARREGVCSRPTERWDPEQEAVLAESVGLALMVVLNRLSPAERVAFVLHDAFGVPFDNIARVVDRTPAAARQLASRARRRVRGSELGAPAPAQHQEVASAFLAAAHEGDFEGLISVLAPGVVFRADEVAAAMGGPAEVRGADAVAELFRGRAQGARVALVDDEAGLVVAPAGRLLLVLRLRFEGPRITGIEAVAAPESLRAVKLRVWDET